MRLADVPMRLPGQRIREIMDLAWATPGVLRLEVGEPDHPTPAHIVDAADRAARQGDTRYTPNRGTAALREAITHKVDVRNGLRADPDQVVVTAGAVQALHAVMMVLADPGDRVLMPDPAWPNFAMIGALLHADVAHYPLTAANGHAPELDDLERLVTPRTRLLVLNSPSNPLGTVLSEDEVRRLLDFAAEHDLWVLSDECYDEIVFDRKVTSPGAIDPDRVISVYSFSKTYAMTGWRVGYAVCPRRVADVLTKIQEPLISCVNAPAQAAAVAALQGPSQVVTDMVASYAERRDAVVALLGEAGIGHIRPEGTFYQWVDISASTADSVTFAEELIVEQGVAVAPGAAFGPHGEGAVRLSLATEQDALLEGTARLIARLQGRG